MKLASSAVLLAAASFLAAGARADTLTVTSLADSGNGTLRDAIAQAWVTPGDDTIVFHPALSGTIHLLSTIFVHGSVTIVGNASRFISIEGSAAGIAFWLDQPTVEFGMIDLEVRNFGSAIYIPIDGVHLNIQRCVFRDNGAGYLTPAGVFNANYVGRSIAGTVQSCSFVNNRGNYAGVTVNTPSPDGDPLEFVNCTFVDNHSTHGAGIALITSPSVEGQGITKFISCTMTNNSSGEADFAAATLQVNGDVPALLVRNCIMDENISAAPINPNISGDNGQATIIEGAFVDQNAGLGPLVTINHLLVRLPQPGSRCIDAASADPDVPADQFGVARPFVAPGAIPQAGSDGSDAGAVEYVSLPCGTDFNRDSAVNSQDFFDFLAAFFAGC